ncbi:hypothetical protein JVU11DRAFT_5798 [Chiua virens]|nr:hypothetical protein JVU11DRAFT_5798 [Chiua virens]
MTIPVYRHNLDYDDWELASVYHSDDCDSMGRSVYDGSSQRTASLDDPALYLQSPLHDDTRPRVRYSVPQPPQPFQDYTPVGLVRPRWETGYIPGKPSSFSPPPAPIVPPPGVIFPTKDWVSPPQEMYWPPTTSQLGPSSDMPVDRGPLEPPPTSLLLSPSTPPPRAMTPLIRRPSPGATIAHGQPLSNTGTVPNVNIHASPIIPPSARYHELGHVISPRLVEAGCQAPPGMAMSPPRRSGYDVLPYAPGSGHPRRLPSSEEITLVDGRYGSGHTTYGPSDRPDLAHPPPPPHPPLVPGKYDHEHEHEYDAGRTRKARSQVRERRPSIWQRFVRRFSPSRASVG